MARTDPPFNPAPVAFHREEETNRAVEHVLSLCGACTGSGMLRLPERRGSVRCHTCQGHGVR